MPRREADLKPIDYIPPGEQRKRRHEPRISARSSDAETALQCPTSSRGREVGKTVTAVSTRKALTGYRVGVFVVEEELRAR